MKDNKHKDPLYAKIGKLTKDDVLAREDFSDIRVKIIKDRNYSVPEWFHKYVTNKDLDNLYLSFTISHKSDISKGVCEFIHFYDERGVIHNHDFYVSDGLLNDNLSLIGYLNPDKTYHTLKKKIKLLFVSDIIYLIESICEIHNRLPKGFIYLYLHKVLGKHWFFAPREKLYNSLVELIKTVKYQYLDIVYSCIYMSHIVNMENGEIPYEVFITKYNGTWYNPKVSVGDYIAYYCDNNMPRVCTKAMDDAILPGFRKMIDNMKESSLEYITKQLYVAIMNHPNNVKFMRIVYDKYNSIENDLKLSSVLIHGLTNEVCDTLDECIIMCNHHSKTTLLDRYVKYGSDIRKVIPYIEFVANNDTIMSFIANITPENLTILLNENPVVYSETNVTLIDVIMHNLGGFNSTMLENIRVAVAHSETAYKSLSPMERSELYYNTGDILTLYTKYPTIIQYSEDISFGDISVMYKTNPEIVEYVKPTSINKELLFAHIRNNGYTPLNHIEDIGLENVFGVHDIATLIMNHNVGYGHLLDFKKMEYRNAVMLAIATLDVKS